MQHITTTNLRTKTSQLVKALEKGESFSLIHRSKIIGVVKPAEPESKPFDVEKFKLLIKNINLTKTNPKQREILYKEHLMKKYGKNIS